MIYSVTLDGNVNFAPENETAEILQNVRTILATIYGTVPLDRDLGITTDHIDAPLPDARIMLKQSIIEAIEQDEPRANLQEVEFYNDIEDAMEGILKPRVIVSIGEDEEDEEI